MSEAESDPGFTVVDRRRRPGDEGTRRPSPPPTAEPSAPPVIPSPEGILAGGPSGPPRPDLASLCVMLYSDALVNLGQVADPMTGQPHQDLDQARFTIDLLGMLQEKTAGNRTAEESAVLQEILSTLRMSFVSASRRA